MPGMMPKLKARSAFLEMIRQGASLAEATEQVAAVSGFQLSRVLGVLLAAGAFSRSHLRWDDVRGRIG